MRYIDKECSAKQGYTRGPWQYDDSQKYHRCKVIRRNGVIVATMECQSTMEYDEAQANARLISAAPEMAEELLHALRDVESRLYMLPIDGKGVSEQKDILSAQIGRYKSVLRKAGLL